MFGWLSPAAARASRRNRSTKPGSEARLGCRTLTATSRARTASWARKTSPIPPAAIRSTTWYRPSSVVRVDVVSEMRAVHWADQAGRIDRKAFEARVRFRFPVWFGNLVLLIGVLFGAAAIVYGMRCDNPTVAGLSFVVAGGAWSVCVHDLAHWAVGRLAGISFLAYYIGGSFPPWPGLKIDYASYLRTSPG